MQAAQLTTYSNGKLTISGHDESVVLKLATLAIAGMLVQAPALPVTGQPFIPEIGKYWPGEGGVNGGFVAAYGDVAAHYLIFPEKDIGRFAWGRHGEQSKAINKRDGAANTAILLSEGDHPAAVACAAYTADGHDDFYWPAPAELYLGWLNIPEKFNQDVWYASSAQFSADTAYFMDFSDGTQLSGGYMSTERSVRPVRRKFI